jgi:hypothetical protein
MTRLAPRPGGTQELLRSGEVGKKGDVVTSLQPVPLLVKLS